MLFFILAGFFSCIRTRTFYVCFLVSFVPYELYTQKFVRSILPDPDYTNN